MARQREDLRTVSCRVDRNYIFEEEAQRLLKDGFSIYYFNIINMPDSESPVIYAVFTKSLDYIREPEIWSDDIEKMLFNN